MKQTPKGELRHKQHEAFVFTLLGLSGDQVAEKMDVGVGTVRIHLLSVYKYFKVNTKAQLLSLYLDKNKIQKEIDKMMEVD